MKPVETRTIIAYLLIAGMIFAAVAGIAYLRRNSARNRHLRNRSRPAEQWHSEDDAPSNDPHTPAKLH